MPNKHSSIIEELRDLKNSVNNILENFEKQQASDGSSDLAPGELPYRVIHLKKNPMDLEIKQQQFEFENLKKENDRLRARLELLETGNDANTTRRIDEAVNNNREIEMLKGKVEELKRRENKILDSFRRTSREFREVCYLLTGYKIGVLKDRIYVLSNMYAEREEDKLFFEISPDGSIQLLKNEFSDRLSNFIKTYLENADSFPAFLSSLTLDLFKSTTQTTQATTTATDISVTMSTTIQPNPDYEPRLG